MSTVIRRLETRSGRALRSLHIGAVCAYRTAMAKMKSARTGHGTHRGRSRGPEQAQSDYWLYGLHAVRAALNNEKRVKRRLVASQNAAEKLGPSDIPVEILSRRAMDGLLSPDTVHQGAALLVEQLPLGSLDETITQQAGPVVILDQVTDPQNTGAIFRSATAFGASAVITTRRRSAPESGALAKAASGGLDIVPYIRVTNLAQAIETLRDEDFFILGLDAEGSDELSQAELSEKVALVLGAEGKGLRQLTRQLCTALVRLPMSDKIESLNVASTAAVALYELARRRA